MATEHADDVIGWDDAPSSPFLTHVAGSRHVSADQQHVCATPDLGMDSILYFSSPLKNDDRDMAATGIPALVPLSDEKENKEPGDLDNMESHTSSPSKYREMMPPPSLTSKRPFYHSPAKPFSPSKHARSTAPPQQSSYREDISVIHEDANIDDTCFSAFSAVPEMTLFSKLADAKHSPARRPALVKTPHDTESSTPRTVRSQYASRSPSPTPRKMRSSNKEVATPSLLIDFTQQISGMAADNHGSVSRGGRLSPSRTEPNLLTYINDQRSPGKSRRDTASPSKSSNLLDLLDFELPPPPTPRSAPVHSVREMESLKASHQSQMLSIKAKLSGKQAEVESLKKALEDAERRLSEAQEVARDEAVKREQADQERADWERRGHDVESVLKTVKDEVLRSEEERQALSQRAEDSERRAEDAEAANLDLRAKLASVPLICDGQDGQPGSISGEQVQQLVQLQLDQKIEGISRELHAVYKQKHETKVAVLKKSYEARNEKKCAELRASLQELTRQNEELAMAKEAALSGSIAGVSHDQHTELRRTVERYRAQIEEQNAKLAGVNGEIMSTKVDHSRLLLELQRERVEKGDLVAAVDEMLSLQSGESSVVIEDFRRSISRPSGLKAPGTLIGAAAGARIGRPLAVDATKSGLDRSKTVGNVSRLGNGRT